MQKQLAQNRHVPCRNDVEFAQLASVENIMQKVLGIGGLFFRSENPDELAQWYQTHLGIAVVPASYEEEPWQQEAGTTVFAPFKKDTTYFDRPEQMWMVNFRVADLEAMVAQLRAADIVVSEPESYPNGDFARLHDPEGNPIELWEPKDPQ
jgi:predicted enzyme related to lactoylglutathione lyase